MSKFNQSHEKQIPAIVSFIERISNSHGGISRPKSVGAMIINIGQPFAVSYSAQIAHFSKSSERPSVTQWAWSGRYCSDTNKVLTMAQLYGKVALMNQDVVVIGRHGQNGSHCAHYGTVCFTATAALTRVIFRISKDRYINISTDVIVEIVHLRILLTRDRGQHRIFERLLIAFGHWASTAVHKYVMFQIFKEKLTENKLKRILITFVDDCTYIDSNVVVVCAHIYDEIMLQLNVIKTTFS